MPLSDARADSLYRLAICDVADLPFAVDLVRDRSQPLLAPREQDALPAAGGEQACVAAPMPLEPPVRTATRMAHSLVARHNYRMDRRERQQIYGQWGGKRIDDDPRDRLLGDAVAQDLEGSPLLGRPQRYRPRNFRPTAESYIASMGGPLPYMRRLRQIADETAEHERQLAEARAEVMELTRGEPAEFAARWEELARAGASTPSTS